MARPCCQQVQFGATNGGGTCGVSKETAAFLDGLLKDKKLSVRAKKEFNDSIKARTSQWVNCVNTGTVTCQQQMSKPHIRFAKPKRSLQIQQPPSFRPSIKTQQQILVEQAQQPMERYSGKPGVDRHAEKERLINVFAYGKRKTEDMQLLTKPRALAIQDAVAAASGPQKSSNQPLQEQLIDQIIGEVDERTAFIEHLQQLGTLTREQEVAVKAEVCQRLAELKRLGAHL